MGEVIPLSLSDGGNRYDGTDPQPHSHLSYDKCGRIVSVEISSSEELPCALARQTGYRIVKHRLDFFGVCSTCYDSQ